MTETAGRSVPEPIKTSPPSGSAAKTSIPRPLIVSPVKTVANHLRNQLGVNTSSPVTMNGSFEFDRVIKSGYVQRRTQKTKVSVVITVVPIAFMLGNGD